MANADPTGFLPAIVSALVNEAIALAKAAIHLREDCKKLEELLNEASSLLVHVKHSQGLLNPRLESWLNKLKDAIEHAKSSLQECDSASLNHPVRGFHTRVKLARKIKKSTQRIRACVDGAPTELLLQIRHEIAGMRQQSERPSNVVPREEQHTIVSHHQIFGMEDKLEQVLSHLLDSTRSQCVGVHGMGGAGKTLLATRIKNEDRIKSHFNPVLWLTFGQSPDLERKQDELAKALGIERDKTIDNEVIKEALNERRCLLILDDVWKARHLDLFEGLLPSNGSKFLITSREVEIFNRWGAIKTQLGTLGEEDSINLFTVHAFPNGQQVPSQLSEVMRHVALKCRGLPLVLKVIGRRMAGKREIGEWDDVLRKLNELRWADVDVDKQVLQRLRLGYDALTGTQKQNFLYFAAFPEDSSMDALELFICWKGEGLVKDIDEALEILRNLRDCALVEEAQEELVEELEYYDPQYRFPLYRMHDSLLALAVHILEEEHPKWYFKPGRQSVVEAAFSSTFNEKISLIGCGIHEIPSSANFRTSRRTTTLLLNDNPLTSLPQRLLPRFPDLQVLCLRDTGLTSLPDSIGELRHLQTLDLSFNSELEIVPRSLGKLKNLSVLDISYCGDLCDFPVNALFKLTKLVYLNTRGSYSIWKQVSFEDLKLMQMLFVSQISHLSVSVGDMPRLKYLSIFDFRIQLLPVGMQSLTNLKVLMLHSLTSLPDEWDWSRLERLTKLSLKVKEECGSEEFRVSSTMRHLTYLCLSEWKFQRLPADQFPSLERLQLNNCTKLLELPISNLVSLNSIEVSGSELCNICITSMPNLYKVYLKECKSTRLSDCPSLRDISLGTVETIELGDGLGRVERLRVWRVKLGLKRRQIFLYDGLKDLTELKPTALPSLEDLDIHKCHRIRRLPDNVAAFPKLKSLKLEACDLIDRLPDLLPSSLERLDLVDMQNLQTLPNCLATLPLLETLQLRRCMKIDNIPFAASDDDSFYPSLRELVLGFFRHVEKAYLCPRLQKLVTYSW